MRDVARDMEAYIDQIVTDIEYCFFRKDPKSLYFALNAISRKSIPPRVIIEDDMVVSSIPETWKSLYLLHR